LDRGSAQIGSIREGPIGGGLGESVVERALERRGIEIDMIDLYADDFDPRLTGAERRGLCRPAQASREARFRLSAVVV
jgi:hypothetical protein